MKIKTSFLKHLVPLAIVFSIFSANIGEAKAGWPVFDSSNFIQNIVTAIKTAGTQVATAASTALHYKDTYVRDVLDRVAAQTAKIALQRMTGEMIGWINDGFKGQPLFISDPSRFFGNIAQNSFQTELYRLMDSDEGSNLMLAYGMYDYFSKRGSDDFMKEMLQPTIYNSIQRSICTTENQQKFADQLKRVGVTDINATYCNGGAYGAGSGNSSYVVNDLFGKSFQAGGGWDTFLEITQNQARNTAQGRLMTAINQAEAKAAAREAELKAEQIAGEGMVNPKECAEYETIGGEQVQGVGGAVCKTWINTSPGIQASQALGAVVTNPIVQQQNIKTFNDALNAIGSAFVNKLVNVAIDEATGLVAGGRDGGTYTTPSFIQQWSATSSQTTQGQSGQMGEDLNNFKDTALPDMREKLIGHDEMVTILNEEKAHYDLTFNRYQSMASQVQMCAVGNGLANFNNRGQQLASKLNSIDGELANIPTSRARLQAKIDIVQNSTDYSEVFRVFNEYKNELASKTILDVLDFRERRALNGGDRVDLYTYIDFEDEDGPGELMFEFIFGKLKKERQDLPKPYCQGSN